MITAEFVPYQGFIGKYVRIYAGDGSNGSEGPIPYRELLYLLSDDSPLPDDTIFELNDMDSGGLAIRILLMWIKKRGMIRLRTNAEWLKEGISFTHGDTVKWVE